MAITVEQLLHAAALARIELSEQEAEQYVDQLAPLSALIDEVQQVNTEQVEPTTHVSSLQNVMRDDTVGECLDREATLAQAPDRYEVYFRVPRVIAGGDNE